MRSYSCFWTGEFNFFSVSASFFPTLHLYQLWLRCSIREGFLPVAPSQIFYSVRYSLFLAGPPSNGPLQQDFFFSDFSHLDIFRGAKRVRKKFLKDKMNFLYHLDRFNTISSSFVLISGSGCSTVVERTLRNIEVGGSNPAGCWAFFLFSILSVVCP